MHRSLSTTVLAGLGAASLSLAVGAVSAAAQTPAPNVGFTLHNVPGLHQGSWSSTGAVADNGGWSAPGSTCVGGRGASTFTCHFPALILDGGSGTLTMSADSRFTATSVPGVYDEVGSWTLHTGSGQYAGMRGEGDIAAVIDFSSSQTTITLSGTVFVP